MSAEEFLCVRCSRRGKTCCQDSEIYVTLGDVARIEQFTGRREFHEFRPPEDPIYLSHDDDPIWRTHVIRPDGTRRVLQRLPAGDCTFLGPRGCELPLDVRPLVCRLYPYDYSETEIYDDLARGCPWELLAPGQSLLTALEMNRADALRWHAQLYEEIRREPPEADDQTLRTDAPALTGQP